MAAMASSGRRTRDVFSRCPGKAADPIAIARLWIKWRASHGGRVVCRHPTLAGHGPTLFAGLSKRIDLRLVSRLEFGSGAVAMRYEPTR